MNKGKTSRVPLWARKPFTHFLEHLEQAHTFYHLSINGILMIIHRSHRIEELTAKLERLDSESGLMHKQGHGHDGMRKTARSEAELAQHEVDQGFPVLNQQVTVDLWGALESLVRDFLAGCLANQTAPTGMDAVRKIKIRVADYEIMSKEERYYYLIEELERNLGAAFKQGINRFEALLDVFGFSGKVGKAIQKDLFELSQVRNVIVHRRGVADRKLVEACPWLGLTVGDRVAITTEAHHRHFDATIGYEKILLRRVTRYFSAVRGRSISQTQTSPP